MAVKSFSDTGHWSDKYITPFLKLSLILITQFNVMLTFDNVIDCSCGLLIICTELYTYTEGSALKGIYLCGMPSFILISCPLEPILTLKIS